MTSVRFSARLAVALLGAGLMFGAAGARADALADIKKAGVIKVGVFGDFPPFSSVSADMSLKGYDIDVAQTLADALKVKLDLVGVTGQNRIPYLTEHRVDLLMSVGKSAEREKVIDFTQAYAPYYIAVIGPKAVKVEGKADLAGKTIAVNRGTLEDTSLTEAAPPSADIKRFDNYNAVIQAFLSGQTQLMVVGNDVGAQVLAKQAALAAGAEVPAPDLARPYRAQQERAGAQAGARRRSIAKMIAGRQPEQDLDQVAQHSRSTPRISRTDQGWPTASISAGSAARSALILSGALMTVFLIVVTAAVRQRAQRPRARRRGAAATGRCARPWPPMSS